MAIGVLERIATEIQERFGVARLAIVHRTGEVPLGEASVAVVAVSPHRDAAFNAARYAIDETKARAPIWKAERFADGHVWVGEPARAGRLMAPTGTRSVKVYISVDMEGVAGVSHPKPTMRGDSGYADAVGLMVGEANAAIEGRSTAARPRSSSTTATAGCSTCGRPTSIAGRGSSRARRRGRWSRAPAGPRLRRRPLRRLPRPGRPSAGTIAHTYSGRPTVSRLNGRLVGESGAQRRGPRPVGRAGRAGQRRRRAGRGGRRLAALGGAGRRQGRRRRQQRSVAHPAVAADLIRDGAPRAVRAIGGGEPRH